MIVRDTAKSPADQYGEKEAAARFEAALKSLAIPPVSDESEFWLWLICAPALKFIGRAPASAVPNADLRSGLKTSLSIGVSGRDRPLRFSGKCSVDRARGLGHRFRFAFGLTGFRNVIA
jgi:hypothetical protein